MGRHDSRADPSKCIITVKPFRNSMGSLLDRQFNQAGTIQLRSGMKPSYFVASKELEAFFN